MKMAATKISFNPPSGMAAGNTGWFSLLLEHLEEFAALAWYLVADHKLVEETFLRAIEQLDAMPFDASDPIRAHQQARETIVTQAIEALASARKEEANPSHQMTGELLDLPRLAFMLRFVISTPEADVAKFLDVTPSEVRELVQSAIEHLRINGQFPELTERQEREHQQSESQRVRQNRSTRKKSGDQGPIR